VDEIFIEGLTVQAIIGILPSERQRPQPLCIDLRLSWDVSRAAASHALGDTLDYAAVAGAVEALAVDGEFLLVETLAERIAERVLADWPTPRVEVVVRKPQAVAAANAVGVRIERQRNPDDSTRKTP